MLKRLEPPNHGPAFPALAGRWSGAEVRGLRALTLSLRDDRVHGAFAWGVLDRLLEEERLIVEGVAASGVGAINASVFASGLAIGGRREARSALSDFWRRAVRAGGVRRAAGPNAPGGSDVAALAAILPAAVDFDALREDAAPRLFIETKAASELGVLVGAAVTAKTVAASLRHGPATRETSIRALICGCKSRDLLTLRSASASPECSAQFNTGALGDDLARVADISRRVARGEVAASALRRMRRHAIDAPAACEVNGLATRLIADWALVERLCNKGRHEAETWLADGFDHLGRRSSIHPWH
jgi:NTE family protein